VDADRIIAELIESPPAIYTTPEGKNMGWGIDEEVILWLADRVSDSWNTLETGCGVSSIVFALKAGRHTMIAPHGKAHTRVRDWCAERGVSTDHVKSIVGSSQDELPRLVEDGPLDLVLIDGAHVFPLPMIDWYYTAVRLRVGGYVVIDDMHIRACSLLCEFLAAEEGRWRLAEPVGRAQAFEKVSDELFPRGAGWTLQPWQAAGEAPARRSITSRIRHAARRRSLRGEEV
jgi:Methyltransferase domain